MFKMVGKEEITSGFDTVHLVANLEQMDKDSVHIIYGMIALPDRPCRVMSKMGDVVLVFLPSVAATWLDCKTNCSLVEVLNL